MEGFFGVATILWYAAGAVTVASIAYLLLAIGAVATRRVEAGPGWPTPPRVTLLKPLCGDEDGLEAALESFFTQQIDFPLRVIFGVADPADPALAVARRVAARHPGVAVQFVIDRRVCGANPKVSNLINMAEAGLDDVVAISDSDILIAPGTLQAAIDRLAAPGVGAVTTAYRAKPGIAGDRVRSFGAWNIDYWDLPMQILFARLTPLSVTYGPLTAVRGEVLASIGGFAALADHLCDDAALGRLVRETGHAIAFTPALAETLINDARASELFRHELRWARTVRGLEPLGYVMSVVSNPGPIPLLLLLRPGWATVALIAVPIILRWVLARLVASRLGRAEGLATPGLIGVWLRDMACFAVWASAFTVAHVGWRGQRLALHDRDLLKPAGQPQR
jgi:ceramide glucosyltransferase